jgi:hypothetical protein
VNPNPAFSGAPAGSNAKDALNIPSVLLIVSGGLGVLSSLARMVMGAGDISKNPAFAQLARDPAMAQQAEQIAKVMAGPVNILVNLFVVALSAFVIFGALKMRTLQGHGIAMGAAIVSLIPCSGCCCLGIPVGIWALMTLSKPEVKSQFQA